MVTADPGTPILLYHRIGRPPRGAMVPGQYVSPGLFRRHLDYLLARGYTAVSLLDLPRLWAGGDSAQRGAAPPAGRPVVITFDDGYRCLHQHALPALAERGLTATVFLVAGALGADNYWEQAIGDVAEPMLGLSEIREMRSQGLEFGSHTLSHAHLTRLPPHDARREIAQSRQRLEEQLGERCLTFAYPYGEWDQRVRDLTEEAGYELACSTRRASARPGDDPLALPRLNIRRYNLTPRFAYKLWRAERAR